MLEPRTDIKTLIEALRILANDIQSNDGVANACIWEAANRLEEMDELLAGVKAGTHVVVPVEPTQGMIAEGYQKITTHIEDDSRDLRDVWQAMIWTAMLTSRPSKDKATGGSL